MPNAPEVKNPATARAMVTTAGTMMGLKRRKTGKETAAPNIVPVKIIPARLRRTPPTGKRVTTASTWEVEGPFSWRL